MHLPCLAIFGTCLDCLHTACLQEKCGQILTPTLQKSQAGNHTYLGDEWMVLIIGGPLAIQHCTLAAALLELLFHVTMATAPSARALLYW